MRTFVFILFLLSVAGTCLAIDHSSRLISLVNLSRENTTQQKITAMFGKPEKVEENKHSIKWHYINENSNLVISWNKKSGTFENFSFTNMPSEKMVCTNGICRKLQSGTTDIAQAIQLLGTPADMNIKGTKQEMHYAYQNSVLRLFFRNHVLVDFTLLSQPGK